MLCTAVTDVDAEVLLSTTIRLDLTSPTAAAHSSVSAAFGSGRRECTERRCSMSRSPSFNSS